MGFLNQLLLLLWKNFTLRKRKPLWTIAELLFPLALFLILVGVRTRPDLKVHMPECHYDGKAMPSAGIIPFLQSFMCTLTNKCYQTVTADEEPGQEVALSRSLLVRLFEDVEKILQNNTEREILTQLVQDWETLNVAFGEFQNTDSVTLGQFLINPRELIQEVQTQNISLTTEALEMLLNASLSFQQGLDYSEVEKLVEEMAPNSTISLNETIDLLRDQICNKSVLSQFLTFPDESSSQMVHDQLCNLTADQSRQLYLDFRSEINGTYILSQITDFIQNSTGKSLNILEMFDLFQQIYSDIIRLESFGSVINDLNQTTTALRANSSQTTYNSELFASLFCGRMDTFGELTSNDLIDRFDSDSDQVTNRSSKSPDSLADSSPCSGMPPIVMEFLDSFSGNWRNVLCKQFKPLLMGYINYAPDTPAVRQLINEASVPLVNLKEALKLAANLTRFMPSIETALGNLKILSMPGLCDLLEGQLRTQAGFNQSFCTFVNTFFTTTDANFDWTDALNATESVLRIIGQISDVFSLSFKGYASESDLLKDSLRQINNYTFMAAVVFEGEINETIPSFVKYKIRMDTAKVDSTMKIMDKYWRPGPRDDVPLDTKYITFGFAFIQDLIDHAIIQEHTGSTDTGVILQQFPYPCYIRDKFVLAISRTLPLFMVLAWVFSIAMLCKSIVYEKELRLKEVMKIMGLDNGVHWVAWFINAFIMMFATTVLLIIIFKYGRILEYSNPVVVLLFLTLFIASTISQCFLISVFFSRANLAACCAGFIYFLLYLPYTFVVQWESEMTLSQKMAASLSSNVAFGYGCSYIAQFEEQTEGVQWSNLASSPAVDDQYNMSLCLIMMVIDTIIYLILTWYIEAVFPGQYGIPRKWYFPIQKSYWFGLKPHNFKQGAPQLNDYATYELGNKENQNLEAEPSDKTLGVSVCNLKKIYKDGKKVAVDGLSLNFYEGQITSFLGHNGAGKTTTMSILTGLFPPTEGTGYIYGRDIRTDMDKIRHSLGMCPQHNVLFDLLTVEEHLWFYARLKGQNEKKVKEEMEKMIKNVGLPHKRKDLSCNLSGGMKRKLSVAIAFVGGSQTVILDEPTAGVDPYARRAIWDLLLKLKEGRTIIMSTHHMDEADVLGDRIAIISQGKLCCCGSSLFLKTKYGSGYYLTLVKDDKTTTADVLDKASSYLSSRPLSSSSVRTIVDVQPIINEDDEGYAESNRSDSDPSSKPPTPPGGITMMKGFSESRVTAFIQKYVPGSKMIEDNGIEMCFQLPESAAHTGEFTTLFKNLEISFSDLCISSYGISDTTLEEVFLKVADDTNVDVKEELEKGLESFSEGGHFPRSVTRSSLRKSKKHAKVKRRSSKIDAIDLLDSQSIETGSVMSMPISEVESVGESCTHIEKKQDEGYKLMLRQFLALIIKRFHRIKRSKKEFFCEFVMPAGFILLSMIFAMITPPYREEPPLELHPWVYVPTKGDPHINMFYSNDAPNSRIEDSFEETILTRPGVGNRCMKPDVYQIQDYPCMPESSSAHKWTVHKPHNGSKCSCASGFQHCPSGAAGHPSPMTLIPSTDYLHNMTSHNITEWLLKTNDEYRRRRYGGLAFGKVRMDVNVNVSVIQEALQRLSTAANNGRPVINGNESIWENLAQLIADLQPAANYAKVWYNNKGWISSVAYMNVMNNLILRSTLPTGKDPSSFGISTINHPMEFTRDQLQEKIESSFVDIVIAMCVIFAMSFIPASLVMFLIEDRESNSKHLQFVSGVNPTMYWIANFIWDMLNYLIPSILFIFIFLAFNRAAYISPTNGPCLVLLLLLFGFAMIPLMYTFSRLFSVPSTALVILMSVNVFLGTVSTLSTFILEIMEQEDEELANINVILKQVFLVLPQYCLGRGLLDMSKNQLYADAYESLGGGFPTVSPFEWEQVGRNLFSLLIQGLVFFTLNWLIEYEFFIKSRHIKPHDGKSDIEDVDVKREHKRVMSGEASSDVLRIENLTKVYKSQSGKGKQTAVDKLCLGVPRGQCFGLLGVNGAGKTTTFKMLTGDTHVSKGNAFVNGHSILKSMVKVRQQLGYCPQFDAVEPLLTGREQLYFYARLRGVPESDLKEVADWGIRKMGLLKYADRLVGTYSGGNKRKLSTAISLIGNPPIIFLDEPTTGMDPGARRFLWDRINDIVREGRSVILTSHSMEECEALCGRLAIMVNGTFRCLGSIQHLKNRFGSGYTLILHMSGEHPDLKPVKDFISETFTDAVLKDTHHNVLQYQLSQRIPLSTIFGYVEQIRTELGIEYYSVSQTTLDQVFINFAKLQTDLLDEELEELPDDMKLYETQFMKGLNDGEEDVAEFEDHSMSGSTINLIQPDNEGGAVRIHLPTYPDVTV